MPRPDAPAGVAAHRILAIALVATLAALLFWSTLLFGGALHGYDWGSHHFNYFDWVRESLTRYGTIPLFMNDAWVTKNFLANAESPSLGPLVWLLFLVPTGVYLKLLLVLYTAAGLTGMVLLLRELGVGAAVSLLVSIPFAFGGFFVAHLSVGHPWAMGGQLLPLLLLLYRRAARGSGWAVLGAAALNASAILAGQHQPFIWQNLLLAAYALAMALQCRSPRPLVALAAIVVATTAAVVRTMIADAPSPIGASQRLGRPLNHNAPISGMSAAQKQPA